MDLTAPFDASIYNESRDSFEEKENNDFFLSLFSLWKVRETEFKDKNLHVGKGRILWKFLKEKFS